MNVIHWSEGKGMTTQEVADRLGIQRMALLNWLSRHSAYRPAARYGFVFVWTEAEVEAVARARSPKGKRKNDE